MKDIGMARSSAEFITYNLIYSLISHFINYCFVGYAGSGFFLRGTYHHQTQGLQVSLRKNIPQLCRPLHPHQAQTRRTGKSTLIQAPGKIVKPPSLH